jgi:competence protein ComEA
MQLSLPVLAGVIVVAATVAGYRAFVALPHQGFNFGTGTLPVVTAFPRSDGVSVLPTLGAIGKARAAHSGRHGHNGGPAGDGVPIVVYVAGAVAHPGLYRLPARARADDALRAAGGAHGDADLLAVNLAARLADGDEVAIYPQGSAPGAHARRSTTHQAGANRTHARKAKGSRKPRAIASDGGSTPEMVVDLNTAGASELETLPGVGSALAERIITVRETSGPFGSLDDLLDVAGMTAGKVDAITPYAVVR